MNPSTTNVIFYSLYCLTVWGLPAVAVVFFARCVIKADRQRREARGPAEATTKR